MLLLSIFKDDEDSSEGTAYAWVFWFLCFSWHINFLGLFNDKATLVEKQQCYYLSYGVLVRQWT